MMGPAEPERYIKDFVLALKCFADAACRADIAGATIAKEIRAWGPLCDANVEWDTHLR
jgi:hypothetical protein